jgi:flagellar basal-body rod protein FlgB
MSFDQMGLEVGRYLTWLSRRQEVIASNIANADTPGYKTRDVNVPSTFLSVFDQARDVIVEAPGLPARNDGNNVSMDREARLLSENATRFNIAVQMVRGEFKNVRSAIEEGRTS